MKNVLIISGHPNLAESVANRAILDELAARLPQAQIRKLDELNQHGEFDIAAEQQALLAADVIVWQFPFHWYSMPALMKKWLDEVFLHGFSHGSKGKLGGKKLIVSVTTGAPAAAYGEQSLMKHSMEALLAPFDSIAALCNLEIQAPVYSNGLSYLHRGDEAGLAAQQQQAKDHAERLVAAINAA